MASLYVWQHVASMTDRYHAEAGVAVSAESLTEARAIAEAYAVDQFDGPRVRAEYPQEGIDRDRSFRQKDLDVEPLVIPLAADAEPVVLVFPDAGCC